MTLHLLARQMDRLRHNVAADPLKWVRWTPPQLAFVQDPAQVKLMRGANQVGKTWAQCAEVIWRCTGTHPYLQTHRPPIEAWIICHSWEQSVAVQTKFWELVPKGGLHEDVRFRPGKGFSGTVPIVRFANGSLVRFKTTNQGSLGLASATIHYVGIDEPPPPEIWGELKARVLRNRGIIGMTLTPVGAPVAWLKELVEAGQISDHPAPLTLENLTPEGLTPLLSAERIQEQRESYLPIDRAQRADGAWEGSTSGRVFEAFDEECISSEPLPPLKGGNVYKIGIGIDHGADAGSQVALLVAVDLSEKDRPKVWVLDEYTAGSAPADHHARAFIRMIQRNGMQVEHVDKWVGDRRYGGKRSGGRMSNAQLMRALNALLDYPMGHLPFKIRTAWKPRWSVYWGSNILHGVMQRQNFTVHPRCTQLIKSLKHWTFKDDEYKHAIDALRYGVVSITHERIKSPVNRVRMY